MTTLVAFSTKDAIIMGCDSLGTNIRPMVDPSKLTEYFDFENDGKLKSDEKGNPLPFDFWNNIMSHHDDVPYNHMTHIGKLFEIGRAGVMTSGVVSIGDTTLKSIIQNINSIPGNISIHDISKMLLEKVNHYYKEQYPNNAIKASIEFLVGGWEIGDNRPKIYRVKLPEESIHLELDGNYGIAFGGQFREISRLVHGTDLDNIRLIETRYNFLIEKFIEKLRNANPNREISIPDIGKFLDKFRIFGLENPDDSDSQSWKLNGFVSDLGDFSTQNAINCVYWLVELMVRVQEFSNSMPTVGGDIHIAMIDQKDGFKFISEESYTLQDRVIPKDE